MRYFKSSEFDCRCGCGKNNTHPQLLDMLDNARTWAGVAFVINSGCRCQKHNREVGGEPDSAHMAGMAADIRVNNSWYRFKVLDALLRMGFKRIGIGEGFVHVDIDPDKTAEIIYLDSDRH